MKKRILTLGMLLALVAVMALPMAAFAETNTGSGTVPTVSSTISITAPGNFSFGDFTVSANSTASSTNGTTTYIPGNDSASGWQVTATDNNTGTNTGKMLRTTDSHPLTSELQISQDVGSSYFAASSTLTYSGAASGQYTFDAKQYIASDELAGVYSIAIKFTGTLTGL